MTEGEMTIVTIVAAMLFIGGCTYSYIEQAKKNCAGNGYTPGTDAYTQCVEADLQRQRLVMGL
jgi:hypothetical protein